MRGPDIQQESLFSTVNQSTRVPQDHPLRPIRTMVNVALDELDSKYNLLYAVTGRDSIPPEKLLRAQVIMVLYTIRSEWLQIDQINYDLLFRWFIGFSMNDEIWKHSTFTKKPVISPTSLLTRSKIRLSVLGNYLANTSV